MGGSCSEILPALQETRVSILLGKILENSYPPVFLPPESTDRRPVSGSGLQSIGGQKSDTNEQLTHTHNDGVVPHTDEENPEVADEIEFQSHQNFG